MQRKPELSYVDIDDRRAPKALTYSEGQYRNLVSNNRGQSGKKADLGVPGQQKLTGRWEFGSWKGQEA